MWRRGGGRLQAAGDPSAVYCLAAGRHLQRHGHQLRVVPGGTQAALSPASRCVPTPAGTGSQSFTLWPSGGQAAMAWAAAGWRYLSGYSGGGGGAVGGWQCATAPLCQLAQPPPDPPVSFPAGRSAASPGLASWWRW